MFQRARPLRDPVTIHLDGAPVEADTGEPLAVALLGAGKATLARSPKLHRPRGPSCLRGACDGCLARVDGMPNVMTCLRPARGGERIETQNVMGSRESDLLRVTDWFFPEGIDHHHLMAGIPGVSSVMQTFARKLAGLGKLPDSRVAPRPAHILETDVLVVGGGVAGRVTASRLAAMGIAVTLVDDAAEPFLSAFGAPDLARKVEARYPFSPEQTRLSSVVAGVYRGEALVASDEGAIIVRAKAKVFATGAHDGILAVPNNDLPGLFSARALAKVLAHGILPTGKTAIVGDGFWADEVERGLFNREVTRIPMGSVVAIKGTNRVRQLLVRDGKKGERTVAADVVACALPAAPSFEVAAQAGVQVRFVPELGYALCADNNGNAGPGLWAVGECAGIPFEPDVIIEKAERAASHIAMSLKAT